MDFVKKIKTYWGYAILAILVAPIGGIISYFLLRKRDTEAAKLFLWVGISLALIGLLINGLIF